MRSNAKRRERKKLARLVRQIEMDIDRQLTNNVNHPDTYGIYKKDPTARDAIRNISKTATR